MRLLRAAHPVEERLDGKAVARVPVVALPERPAHFHVARDASPARPEVVGDEPAPQPPQGFEAIFNGRDLKGWEGSPSYWKVEDGCLTGTADGTLKYNRFLVWRGGKVKSSKRCRLCRARPSRKCRCEPPKYGSTAAMRSGSPGATGNVSPAAMRRDAAPAYGAW